MAINIKLDRIGSDRQKLYETSSAIDYCLTIN